MKSILAGPGVNAQPGEEIDVPFGQDLCDRGFAEPLEAAAIAVPERAVLPSPDLRPLRAKGARKK